MRIPFNAKSRPVITALDLILIVSAAATVVMLLGARERFFVGSVLITARNPLRPLALALVAGALRRVLGRGQPPLPSLRYTNIWPRLHAELEHIRTPPPATREVWCYAGLAALAALVWRIPHLLNIRHVPDLGDPLMSAWRLARFSHQLLNEPWHLFDGNIFHPTRNTLTFSDPTFLEGLAATPFLAAGVDPVVVLNIVFLASFPLSALAFFFASWRLTGDPQAACVAGVLAGLSTFKVEHYSHLELQFFFFAPLAVIFFFRMLAAPSLRTGAAFGAAVVAQWLACMYLGVMLSVFLVPVALFAAIAWRVRMRGPFVRAAAIATAVIVGGASLTAIPFLSSQSDRAPRSMMEVRGFGATPARYGAAHPSLTTYRSLVDRSSDFSERELFPGVTPLALAAVGIVPPLGLGQVAIIAASAVAFDGSLGLNGLLYDEMYRYLLPFRGMRVPARFAALVGSGLFLLAGYGAARLLRAAGTRNRRALLFVVLTGGALFELRSDVPLERAPETIPPIYSAVTKDMVLFELPIENWANFHYMYFSTFHWARLINGDSGHFTHTYNGIKEEAPKFPTKALLQQLRELGTTHVTVNCHFSGSAERCRALLQAIEDTPELQRVSSGRWQGAEVRLYALGR